MDAGRSSPFRKSLGATVLVAALSAAATAEAGPSSTTGGTVGPGQAGVASPAWTAGAAPDAAPDMALVPLSPATGQRGAPVVTNLLSGPSLQAGSTVDYRPGSLHPQAPVTTQDTGGPVELGGFVGYLFHDSATGKPGSSLGVDLQLATDPVDFSGNWLVQPGLDYSTPIAPALQFNTRLFSTYAPDGYGGTQFGLDRSRLPRSGSSESNFQDVGVGVGLGYSITERWNLQTEARYQRSLGSSETESQNVYPAHQFFGGVMLDYKF